ncbi:hypothetical protein [Luteirhabdus pelagi]|uniref:hypothetical protein n=1 Tax=Luteirhabdus pelagi TaxID=2792783 RepID=UPI001F31A506|nr:hypothetical protein [Luteirhabdus pelagi]
MKVFVEEQRFNQWWLYAIIFATMVTIVISVYEVYDATIIEQTNEFWMSAGIGIVISFIMFAVLFLKLETKIDERGVHYGFWPFQLKLKTAEWHEIEDCYVRQYRPIGEYGGWGYRFSLKKHGKAYNVKGNNGIQIVFKDDSRTLIGTQKPSEVAAVLKQYAHKLNKIS